MGKLPQKSSELWPFIDVRNWFSLSIFGNSLSIVFKLGIRVDIGGGGGGCLGIAFGQISTN